jgi:glutathione S-transferase
MKLYYHPLSTYSQKALIAFNEKGIAYEGSIVDLTSQEARTAFQQVSPIGKVPFFKPSEDWSVPESTSIIEYLEDKFPGTPRLIPDEREAARQVRFADRMADLYLNESLVDLLFQKIGFRAVNEDSAARSRRFVGVSYEALEHRLSKQEWVCGATFSMADCATIPPLFYAQFVAPFTDRPAIAAYWQRAQKRPSYAKVMAEFVPVWEGLMAKAGAAKT